MFDLRELYRQYLASSGITTDSRKIEKGQVFFALKGDNFDGNQYAKAALESGAMLAVVDDSSLNGKGLFQVPNALEALQELAKYHRSQLNIPLIGLTGSNGKTTSKELMHAALSTGFKTMATTGNLNNHIGVPLSILRIGAEHEIAIIEMGANHQGEIAFLSAIAQPTIGYITNYGKAHMEGFGGVEGIIKGKSELYTQMRESGQTVLLNTDDPIQVEKAAGLPSISFGKRGDYRFEAFTFGAEERVGIRYGQLEVKSQLTGLYNFANLCAAFTLGLHYGLEAEQIKLGLENYRPSNSRSEWRKTERNEIVLDAYNANPSSMEVAIENFRRIDKGQKWIILGDMFELGDASEAEHAHIAGMAASIGVEKLLLCGAHFHAISNADDRSLSFPTTDTLLDWLKAEKPSGKCILIKGSRGMRLERCLEWL